MATQKKRYHPKKWAGVYVYETSEKYAGAPDLCFYITYRSGRRLVWEKIGKTSEGYGPDVAAEIRAERVKAVRHGEEVKTAKDIRREKAEKDKPFKEIAEAYFEIKGPSLKGIVTDRNRYEKHLVPLCGKSTVSEITPQLVEELRKLMGERKPATLWNTLELLRRIVNFGYKTNRCPALSFQIEMPVKDNEVIEYLKPDEVTTFLETVRCWPVKDVANMLLLAFFTGMRRGEMFKLETHDLDFHMRLIRIRSPKGGKSISIGMSDVASGVLQDQLAWRAEHFPESNYVFPGKFGEMRKDCSAVDTIKKAAGLPAKFRPFHGLRHHFAVTLANSGQFTLDMIAEMLTHKNAEFTKKKYGQFLPESMTAAGNAAAKILGGL
ncbi:tyrosine-type recombinase/integrase [Desulfovibrio cuneatus]|uniref:tyrosine-type recombinase/integrase n=1 Tax=Desulfovibrio cuneatus TaxID=159728 RepID=UPI00042122FB|nr:tyrosine-type recombinase/integrase [Desulfovibrio cuneatus]